MHTTINALGLCHLIDSGIKALIREVGYEHPLHEILKSTYPSWKILGGRRIAQEDVQLLFKQASLATQLMNTQKILERVIDEGLTDITFVTFDKILRQRNNVWQTLYNLEGLPPWHWRKLLLEGATRARMKQDKKTLVEMEKRLKGIDQGLQGLVSMYATRNGHFAVFQYLLEEVATAARLDTIDDRTSRCLRKELVRFCAQMGAMCSR